MCAHNVTGFNPTFSVPKGDEKLSGILFRLFSVGHGEDTGKGSPATSRRSLRKSELS
jgi:hypothetical protein